MLKKCDANCDAKVPHLWLRNNIFYYRVELERVGGKRRYKRISLHTDNFFEARDKLRAMTTDKNWPFNELRRLFNDLIFDVDLGQGLGNGNYGMLSQLQIQKRLSKRNKRENIEKLNLLGNIATQSNQMNLSQEDRLLIKQFVEMRPMIEAFLANQPTSSKPTSAPSRKISDVLDMMLLKANNCDDEKRRKKNTITKLLQAVGISLDDDYAKFHNADTISAISKVVVGQADAKGDYKRKQLRYIKELATCGSNIDSDFYKISVINNLPNIEKTKKSEKKPHQPYSNSSCLRCLIRSTLILKNIRMPFGRA